jgi:hypothetical protein
MTCRTSRMGMMAMKRLFLILIIASFALVMIQGFSRVAADGGGGIPLSKLAGKFAQAGPGSGSLTLCFKPDFSATENCSTVGAIPLAANVVGVGQKTQDKDGDSCLTETITEAFPGKLPPIVAVFHGANKVTNYDPATGSGDESFTNYAGGRCMGSKFDTTGATVLNNGTLHFVASDNGERTDFVVTTLTDSLGDIGAFNAAGFNLKQK